MKMSQERKPSCPLRPLPDMQRLLFLLILPGLFITCASEGPAGEIDTSPYFDLAGYITAETERLSASKPTVEKTITLNGIIESQQLKTINFESDLRLFREADINKPAWLDKYTTEEQALSADHSITTYVAQDSSLIVRELMVEKDQGVPIKIEIIRHTGTLLSDGRHRLTYEPATGYRVVTTQKNRFGDDLEGYVWVKW
jgi:hypothetical protein